MNRQDRKTLAEHALALVNRLEDLPIHQRFEVLSMALAFLNIEQARVVQMQQQQQGPRQLPQDE